MTLSFIKGATPAPRGARSKMETLLVNLAQVERWKLPPFQRPLRENEKVRAIAERLKGEDKGCVPGVLTLGRTDGDPQTLYIVDGQHRIHAFKISGLEEAIMDVRICDYCDMAEMAMAFVELNSAIVRMRPDDILRGMEGSVPAMKAIRQECSYVGYDQIRRGGTRTGPIVSMSALLRTWHSSGTETPGGGSSQSALELAQSLDMEEAKRLTIFLNRAHAAWGRDPEYFRLWASLNLTICMWLWRRMVLNQFGSPTKRHTIVKAEMFQRCLSSLSADAGFIEWLGGRALNDINRNPAYGRIKAIFTKRLSQEGISASGIRYPQAAWVA